MLRLSIWCCLAACLTLGAAATSSLETTGTGAQTGQHDDQHITRRLLQSGTTAGISLSSPNAPPPQQPPDAAPARSRRVKKDVEIVVAAVIGLLLLVGGVFCVLCVLCRRDRLPSFIRKLMPNKASGRSEYMKYQETQEQCLPTNMIGRGAAAT